MSPPLVFAIALGAGVFAQLGARHLRIPSIVLLLFAGVALGPDGLGWVQPDVLGDGLFHIVQLAVAVILFEGGLNLELRRLRRQSLPIRQLVTVGALITAMGGAIAARVLMDWPWSIAAVFGSLVVVTGPTVIKPLLRLVPLRPRLATVLEAEGVLIDPIGVILATVTLEIALEASVGGLASGVVDLLLKLLFGAGVGLGFGFALARLLRSPRIVPEGMENLVALGSVLVVFEVCELLVPEAGILAVTVAGVVLGNSKTRVGAELGQLEEHLTIALIGVLFVLLAADVGIYEVTALGWPGVATVAALVLLVRPLSVLVSTRGSELDWRERGFLSWVAPRGIVAAAVASLFAAVMAEAGIAQAVDFRALVFLTIGVTVVLQGGTAPLVARLVGVRAPGRENVVILGAEELAFALADVLREGGRNVVFVDSNPGHCRAAEERDYPVVYGNALASSTLARIRLERARQVVGLTANDEVNSLFAGEARQDFGVPETYVALRKGSTSVTPRILEKQESHRLFDGPKDVERWNVRLRHGSARVETLQFTGVPEHEGAGENGRTATQRDDHLVLAVRRGAGWSPMHAGFEARAGDDAAVVVHSAEEASAYQALHRLGWTAAGVDDDAPDGADAD